MSFNHLEEKAILKVIKSGILSGYRGNLEGMYGGEEVRALEKEWAEYFGVKHAIAVNSNTSGLWCALSCILNNNIYDNADRLGDILEINKSEVIVTPYSMSCSATLPLLFGAKPVFADIEQDYFCLDAKSIESKITENTKAIIVVDLFGQPYNVEAINAIGKKYNIPIIEDAAQSPGAKYKGKYTGTLGDIGVFSLNYHKHIHCGEGGIVVTDNDEYAFKIRLSMNHSEAIVNDYYIGNKGYTYKQKEFMNSANMVGMNLRMTELQACIARIQLTKLDDILKIYREDAKYFPVKVRPDCEHSFYRYAFTEGPITYDMKDLFNYKRNYITPLYKMPLFVQLGYNQDLCPTCEVVNENIILAWHKVMP